MPRWFLITLIVILVVTGLALTAPLGTGTAKPGTPDYSAVALNALIEAMLDAHVDTGNSRIVLAGVASSGEELAHSLTRFRESVPDRVELSMDIFVIDTNLPLGDMCARMFTELGQEQVRFRHAAIDIRTSSHATLDRIADFARDCRESGIAITGHSDAIGDETINVILSKARAQAVADYLVSHGASANQLRVTGAGSEFPIADNATPQGREQNRRIEFDLRQSQ